MRAAVCGIQQFFYTSTKNVYFSPMTEDTSSRFSTILGAFGAILIGCGVAWLVATNWHWLSSPLKILILVGSTAVVFAGAVALDVKGHPGMAGALNFLGAHLFTLSIFLIAQIFSTSASLQGSAHLVLLSCVGTLALAYLLRSSSCLIVSLFEFLMWIGVQFFAFVVSDDWNSMDLLSMGWLGVCYLLSGAIFFALSLLHSGKPFGGVYRWWSAFYVLLLAYLLSFHFIVVSVWELLGSNYDSIIEPTAFFGTGLLLPSPLRFPLLIFAALSIGLLAFAISKRQDQLGIIKGGVSLLIGTGVVLFVPSTLRGTVGSCVEKPCYEYTQETCDTVPANKRCIWKESQCQYDYSVTQVSPSICGEIQIDAASCMENQNCRWSRGYFSRYDSVDYPARMSSKEWLIWIGANVWLLAAIVTIVGYGVMVGSRGLVNLAIATFTLQVITRYLGFMIDYWGYTSLSFVFISGGIILIFGGIGIQKWRRHLLKKTQSTS